MSVYVTSWIWNHSPVEGLDRLVLLAIADCANDDGGGAYPGVDYLSKTKCKIPRSTLYKILGRLQEQGHLVVDRRSRGGRGVRTIYRVVMATDAIQKPSSSETVDPDPLVTGPIESYPQDDAENGNHPPQRRNRPTERQNRPRSPALTSGNADIRQEPSRTTRARTRENTRCRHRNDPAECGICSGARGTPPPPDLREALKAATPAPAAEVPP